MSLMLYYASQMEQTARYIAAANRQLITLGYINWERYKEGFPNTVIGNIDELRYSNVAFLACFDSMGAILEQIWALRSMIARNKVNSMHIFVPCFPTGTKDRWTEEGEVVTAFELANTFKLLPPTLSGPIDLTIFDIHALQEESYFPDNIRVDRRSLMPALKRHHLDHQSDVSIAFPDDGAYKRYSQYFDGYSQIVCEKRRVGDDRIIVIKEGDPNGRRVYIVDDLGLSGKTSVETKKVLVEAGAAEVSLWVSHGMFPGAGLDRVASAGFSEIWMSDSWPATVKKVNGQKPFHILNLDLVIQDILIQDLILKAQKR